MEDLNIALLIDSDNVSSRYISGILSELSKYGAACTATGPRTGSTHG